MKVFISWSGSRSKTIAEALYKWMPMVIQSVEPWMAPGDIEKGSQWVSELSGELAQNSFGIICLTPENLSEPWILFEAGALSKAVGQPGEEPRVCTYLFEVEPVDVGGPLAQFQHTRATKEDTKLLLVTMNKAVIRSEEKGPTEETLSEVFEALWQKLEQQLTKVPDTQQGSRSHRPEREILEELVGLVRNQARTLDELSRTLYQRLPSPKRTAAELSGPGRPLPQPLEEGLPISYSTGLAKALSKLGEPGTLKKLLATFPEDDYEPPKQKKKKKAQE
ncbi:toll/interleukin-1 receptor domain-containing protein [Acidobacteria bacterium AH-259-A15]|nr:toll/interleukin-1 receptor domain-containing protein [Acidobacteria bacterium AH-259-A15]